MPNFPPLRDCRNEYSILRLCAGTVLEGDRRQAVQTALNDPGVDYDLLVDLAHWHCVSPLLYRHLEQLAPSFPALEELKENYSASSLRYGFQSSHALEILSELQTLGLKPIALKGLALAEPVYKDPGLRSMGDLDIWLPDDEPERADLRLRELGWFSEDHEELQNHTRAVHHHLPRLNSPDSFTSVEIHRALHEFDSVLHGPGYLKRAETIELTAVDDSGELTSLKTLSLGPADQLIALATHFSLDRAVYYQSYAALRQLTDIAEVARTRDVDWKLVAELAQSQGLEPWVWMGLESAARLTNAPIPEGVRETLQTQVPKASRLDQFIEFKVLEPSPWVLHQLVQPAERSSWSLFKALLRRFLWDPRYLDDKFGHNAEHAYRRHGSEMLRAVGQAPSALRHLRVDGWMAELHNRGAQGTA